MLDPLDERALAPSVVTDGHSDALLEHQVEGIRWLAQRPHALLADEPGLGKTAQLLRSAREPAIVVAPAMVLDSGVWDDEIAKWTPGLDITQVAYSVLCERNPRGRVERDANGWPKVRLREPYRRGWGTAIADESHYLKGRKTSWTSGFFQLADRASEVRLATGTPIPNWAHEAFTSLQLIWPERARPGGQFGSYWRWAREWFDVGPTLWSPMGVQGFRADRTWTEFYEANWGNRMLLRERDTCLDLPQLTQQRWLVKMGREQARVYRELKRDFVTWLESGDQVASWTHAAQTVNLARIATGIEALPGVGADRGSGKLDALRTLLADRPRPTLVVAFFQRSVELCAEAARAVGQTSAAVHGGVSREGRRNAIRAFQKGNLDVLCASVDTISEGLTLHQGGADQVILVERSARPSRNEQVIRRLHRMGVTRPVSVIDLVTEGTWDERLFALLQRKTDQQMLALGRSDLRALA